MNAGGGGGGGGQHVSCRVKISLIKIKTCTDQLPDSRTNYGLARFKVAASKIWEKVPAEIKCLPHCTFKNEYNLFLLSSRT